MRQTWRIYYRTTTATSMKALILIIKLWNLQFNLKMTQWWRAESIYQFLGISIEIGTEHWYVIATHTTLPFNMTGFSLPCRRVSNCRAFAVVGAVLSPPPVNVHRGTVWECDSQCLLHRCTALLPFRVDYFEGLSVPGLTPLPTPTLPGIEVTFHHGSYSIQICAVFDPRCAVGAEGIVW